MNQTPEHTPRSIFASLLLHVFLIGLAVFIVTEQQKKRPDRKLEVIQIDEIRKSETTQKKPENFSGEDRFNHPKDKSEKISSYVPLSALGMRISAKETVADQVPDEWDTMNPDPRIARFNQYIYHTVQGWLDRTVELENGALYGTVKMKLSFTAKGEYIESESTFQADDPTFERLVRRAIRKSFESPIPETLLVKHERFSIERKVIIR